MPTREFDEARRLLDELESRWISLLLWLATKRGISLEAMVETLGDVGLDALNTRERRLARTPAAAFTPLHFLPFPAYVDVAAAHARNLVALGVPPANWLKRLRDQNGTAITYRNDLQHAQRFDDLPPKDRGDAVAVFRAQIEDLKDWWPDHPYTQQPARDEDEDPLRSAVRLVGRDERAAGPLAAHLGFTAIKHPTNLIPPGDRSQLATDLGDGFGSLYEVGRKSLSGNNQAVLFLAVLDDWPEQAAARERYRRRLARALVNARGASSRFLILLIDGGLQADGSDQIKDVEIVYPRQRANRPFGTVRAVIDLSRPTRYQVDLLRELNIAPANSLQEVAKRWSQAFDVERVTNRFYNEFRALRDRLAAALLEHNPDHPELAKWSVADLTAANPSDAVRQFQLNVTSFATRQLSRLLFLWFLQQKGWLGDEILPGSPTFLVDLFRTRPKPGNTYFAETLVPLFFDGVGRPPEDPRHRAVMERLGGSVPYLDGGLFRADADAFERALFGVDPNDVRRHTIVLPDALFDPTIDNPDLGTGRGQERQRTVLGLLRGYRFTTQESTPDDQSVDPDPELLGKVFENLYQEDDRHETGAYYTPREIVRYMCRRALDGYLLDQTGDHGVTQETLDRLREEAVDWETTDLHLSPAQERVLTSALERVTVIDPAVGSGAFLVGMLQEITLLRRGIRSAALDAQIERGSEDVYDWKRHAVTRSLHGVDVNPTAVEICRLRLWLSLVIEFDLTRQQDIPALPNLEFRVIAGDSLVDRVGATSLLFSLPNTHIQPDFDMRGDLQRLDLAIERYRVADTGSHQSATRISRFGDEIRAAWLNLTEAQLERTIVDTRFRLATLNKAARPQRRAIATAEAELHALEQLRANLRTEAPVLKPLLWPLVFREVFERGGFDIAIANPPYVRQESLSPVDQQAYAAAFQEFYAGTGDLYVSFFARALQIVRDGGWLSFITSNKYMRAGYGERPRQALAGQTQIAEVIDFGDLPVFGAAAYPAILIARKMAAPVPDQAIVAADLNLPVRRRLRADGRVVNVESVRTELDDLPALIQAAAAGTYPQALLRSQGWILDDPVLVRLFERLMNEGTPLGTYVKGRMYYGIKTGLNEAFVIDQATRDALIAADPRSAEVIKPWLRGRDIKRWRPEWAGLYLIAIQNSGDRDAANPWGKAANESEARRIFAATYPAIYEHIRQHELRLRPRADQGRYWWELRACAYYDEFARPKVFWPDIAKIPQFAVDERGHFGANTIYFSPALSSIEAALLNSLIGGFLMSQISPAIQNGYRRYFTQYVETLPLPVEIPDDIRRGLEGICRSGQEAGLDELAFAAYRLEPAQQRALLGFRERSSLVEDNVADDAVEPDDGA